MILILKVGLKGLQDFDDTSLRRFPHGTIRRVNLEDIQKSLILCEARHKCAQFQLFTSDPVPLIKYLSESHNFDLALDLALAFDTHAYYPATLMLKEYHLLNSYRFEEDNKINHDQVLQDASDLKGSKEPSAIIQKISREKVLQVLSRLKINDKSKVVHGLISEKVQILEVIEDEIVNAGLIKQLVEYYLNKVNLQLEKAIDVIRRNIPKSVQMLADLDIQLLVFILQTLEQSITENSEHLKQIQRMEEAKIQMFMRQVQNDDIKCSDSFAEDIEDFFGVEDTRQLFHISIKEKYQKKGIDQDLDNIREDIEITEVFLTKARAGQNEIKRVLVEYLNRKLV